MSKLQSQAKSGERNPRCKVTRSIAAAIRKAVAGGLPHGGKAALAKRYGISPSTVSAIIAGRIWSIT